MMMLANLIGKDSPEYSRLWRNLAHFSYARSGGYAYTQRVCQFLFTGSAPQNLADPEYHFRTPSPGGQRPSFRGLLLAIFFSIDGARAVLTRLAGTSVGSDRRMAPSGATGLWFAFAQTSASAAKSRNCAASDTSRVARIDFKHAQNGSALCRTPFCAFKTNQERPHVQ